MTKMNWERANRRGSDYRVEPKIKPKLPGPNTAIWHIRITFGAYRGWLMKNIPREYLEWLALTTRETYWQDKALEELQRRYPEYRV